MNWELRADPGRAPGERNIGAAAKRRSIWPSIAVVAAAATFGGVIWFAYQNGRDAGRSGLPPLVKAEPGPVKVKPDNPGGQEIPFQDSTVYDRLGQGNGQKPVIEKLLPPPEAPVTRAPPEPAQAQSAPELPPARSDVAPPSPAPAPVQALSTPVGPGDGSPTVLAPLPGSMIPLPSTPKLAPKVTPKPESPSTPAVAKTKPVPAPSKAQPDSIAALIAEQGAAPSATPQTASGGYRLQLSAVRSPDAVEPEWARLKRRFPELAALKSSSSKTEVAGKGTFYRVEAGPLDEAAARAICNHLRTQGLGCIVARP